MAVDIVSLDQGQLSILYSKWKKNPSDYDHQLVETLDRIIHSRLEKKAIKPYYRKIEDLDDLVQGLRLVALKALNKVENPTNKRLFNYLRISIDGYLKDQTRKVCRQLRNEAVERKVDWQFGNVEESSLFYSQPVFNKIAELQLAGHNRKSIQTELNLTKRQLEKLIEEMRNLEE